MSTPAFTSGKGRARDSRVRCGCSEEGTQFILHNSRSCELPRPSISWSPWTYPAAHPQPPALSSAALGGRDEPPGRGQRGGGGAARAHPTCSCGAGRPRRVTDCVTAAGAGAEPQGGRHGPLGRTGQSPGTAPSHPPGPAGSPEGRSGAAAARARTLPPQTQRAAPPRRRPGRGGPSPGWRGSTRGPGAAPEAPALPQRGILPETRPALSAWLPAWRARPHPSSRALHRARPSLPPPRAGIDPAALPAPGAHRLSRPRHAPRPAHPPPPRARQLPPRPRRLISGAGRRRAAANRRPARRARPAAADGRGGGSGWALRSRDSGRGRPSAPRGVGGCGGAGLEGPRRAKLR